MVDKAVDSGWKNQTAPQNLYTPKDKFQSPDSQKTPEGLRARVLATLMTFFMTLFFFSCSFRVTKKLADSANVQKVPETISKEELRPPSFADAEVLSSIMKRLGELEEKVYTLQAKPSEIPYEKEELLNAAVYRVDALEAELIDTKKYMNMKPFLDRGNHLSLKKNEIILVRIDDQYE